MKITLALASIALMSLTSVSFAAPTVPKAAKQAALVCPVTHESIASVKDAAGHSEYQGKTYYFCCSECKPMFDKNPGAYVKSYTKKSN